MNIKNLNKKIISLIMSGVFSVTLAATKSQEFVALALDNTTSISNSNDKVKIPKEYKDYIDLNKRVYTIDDLSSIKKLDLVLEEEKSLSWLKHCTNLEDLSIAILEQFLEDSTEELNDLDNACFKNLKSFSIATLDDTLIFNADNFAFLKNSPNLEEIYLCIKHIDNNFLESLTTIKRLELSTPGFHTKIDFSKLQNLEEIDFSITNPYDIAMFITNDDIDYFKENNITIKTEEEGYIEKVIEINNQIDSIINELEITKEDNEEEKLEKIVTYVIDKLHYDKTVSDMFYETQEVDEKLLEYIREHFYKEGTLTQALAGDGNAICGNYAALTQILANRLGINSYFMSSIDHAWNLIEIDGKYYYLDTTFIDSSNNNLPCKMQEWYLKPVEEVHFKDRSHYPNNLSDDIEIESVNAVEDYYRKLQEDLEKEKNRLTVLSFAMLISGLTSAAIALGYYPKKMVLKKYEEYEELLESPSEKILTIKKEK